MKIIESFIQGKTSDFSLCEDGIYISDNIIAVIDGVTSKTEKRFDGKKGGAFAKDVIIDSLSDEAVEMLSCSDLFAYLTKSLNDACRNCYSDLQKYEYPKCAIVLYNAIYNEIWSVGDCQCIINSNLYTHEKYIDKINSQMRSYILECAIQNGASVEELLLNDVGREYILPAIKEQSKFENTEHEYGFSILNGFPIPESLIKKYSVKSGDEIILASDGYPVLMPSLQESEQRLAILLRDDPLCFRCNKSTKGITKGNTSFDDRVYCKFTV